jgi:crotonobetainyl-CoA:carnitine CoA-transferase CaiB-like acyl-CoA transferase
MMIKTLEGIKVIDFTLAAAGPTCSKLLAEYGAEVILVEPVNGMDSRPIPQFDFMNTGKKSIPINLKTSEGIEIMHRLLKDADVFVTNYRSRAVKKFGFDYDTLKEKYPRLIHASITGYGEFGPMKDDAGFDVTAFWGRSGLARDMMEKDGPIIVAPSGAGDILTGETLALGICAALYKREKTGKGEKVYTSLLALGLYANFSQMIFTQYGVKYPKSRKATNRALSNSYQTKDGQWFWLITLSWEKDFWNLLRVIGREDLVGDPRWTCMKDTENEKAPELVEIFDEAFSKLTLEEVKERLDSIDMACGLFYGSADAINDPQAIANKYLTKITNSDGKELIVPCSPIKFGEEEPVELSTAHPLGYDTEKVLKELGYSDTEIESFVNSKVVFAIAK